MEDPWPTPQQHSLRTYPEAIRFAKVLSHPLRVRILDELNRRAAMSPNEVSKAVAVARFFIESGSAFHVDTSKRDRRLAR